MLFLLYERSLNLLLGLLMLEQKEPTTIDESDPFPDSIRANSLGSPAPMNGLNTGALILDKQKRVVAGNTWLQAERRKPLHQVIPTDFTRLVHQNGERLARCVYVYAQDAREWGLPSVLSPAIERPVLSLHPPHHCHAVLDQQVTISSLQNDGRQYCLIQVVDMSIVVSRERMLRQKAEDARAADRALEKANAALLELATRDGLTGIANRRCFGATSPSSGTEASTTAQYHHDQYRPFQAVERQVRSSGGRRMPPAGRSCSQRSDHLPHRSDRSIRGRRIRRSVAERLRAAAQSLEGNSQTPACTISVGVAMCQPSPTGNALQRLQHADAALYHAKEGGRNRVVAAAA